MNCSGKIFLSFLRASICQTQTTVGSVYKDTKILKLSVFLDTQIFFKNFSYPMNLNVPVSIRWPAQEPYYPYSVHCGPSTYAVEPLGQWNIFCCIPLLCI